MARLPINGNVAIVDALSGEPVPLFPVLSRPGPQSGPDAGIVPAAAGIGQSAFILKGTAANLYQIAAYSSSACLFALIDAAVIPASGEVISPCFVENLPAGKSVSRSFKVARRFNSGCIALFTLSLSTFTPSATGFVSAGMR